MGISWPTIPHISNDVHDTAAMLFHPAIINLSHENEATGQVVPHHCLESFRAYLFQSLSILAASVVNQRINSSVLGNDGFYSRHHLGLFTNVTNMSAYHTAFIFNLSFYSFKLVRVAPHNSHYCSQ